ncbi:hypothetical protein [Streptomyces sp. NPDC047009]|uniref:hypothetical protein n=1 Tax=Streptomyces sp. NPDC047009 TaxID=3154496 RepID=UPI00340006C1
MAGSEDTGMIITPGGQAGRSFGAAKTARPSFACRSRSAVETHLRALSALNDKARLLCSDDEAPGVWTFGELYAVARTRGEPGVARRAGSQVDVGWLGALRTDRRSHRTVL